MRAPRTGPYRTCVACGERSPQGLLIRLALVDGRVVADLERRRPGRGAYVHPEAGCVEALRRGRGRGRAFRRRLDARAWDALWADLARAAADASS